ncbi:DUF2199 domain-containing protein [Tunturibacter empetritectus]|uniref:DUF2199 domain-containing protein n=1 Tax=Tunturiibacter lichenicola TaxID=2051959 RepID=A0A7W8J3V4_9BACT|nr:DUF2199 domain-containing protein [Edaphobacter lichenicola]MBB5342118.1 hypothetical protein [Edaphobacter lichenicola]
MGIESESGFGCSVCGERHVLSLSYSVKAPLAVGAIPTEEFDQRVVITPDQCVIDGKDFYLRGRILVPVIGLEEPFIWGIWAEVGPKNFVRSNELWVVEGREKEPAFPGWVNSQLSVFGDTYNLEVNVQTQPVGQRPQFTIVNQDHPLAVEQRDGITMERVEEIAVKMLHPVLPDGPAALSHPTN